MAVAVCLAFLLSYTTVESRHHAQKDKSNEKDKSAEELKKPKKEEVKGKDKQVVTSKPTKRVRASSINFRKAYGLPLASLGTLGARIDAARRAPDPVALAHAAGELKVAEKVSGKKASLTSNALLAEAAELAKLRKEVAELRSVYAIQQQIASEETDKKDRKSV